KLGPCTRRGSYAAGGTAAVWSVTPAHSSSGWRSTELGKTAASDPHSSVALQASCKPRTRSWCARKPASRDHALVAFLKHRGFTEWRRRWESVLNLPTANIEALHRAD